MKEQFCRLSMLIGQDKTEKLQNARVAVFGLGGVGGTLAEALVRCGIGEIVIVDNDFVAESNLNRQIISLSDNIGQLKTAVTEERLKSINPDVKVISYNCFYLPGNEEPIFDGCDYIADAIDTVSGKIALIEEAKKRNIPVISCMGTGNKLDPSKLKIEDVSKTSVCPLARVMRRELRKRNIENVKVLYSTEEPIHLSEEKSVPGSFMPVTSCAGLLMASEIIKDVINS